MNRNHSADAADYSSPRRSATRRFSNDVLQTPTYSMSSFRGGLTNINAMKRLSLDNCAVRTPTPLSSHRMGRLNSENAITSTLSSVQKERKEAASSFDAFSPLSETQTKEAGPLKKEGRLRSKGRAMAVRSRSNRGNTRGRKTDSEGVNTMTPEGSISVRRKANTALRPSARVRSGEPQLRNIHRRMSSSSSPTPSRALLQTYSSRKPRSNSPERGKREMDHFSYFSGFESASTTNKPERKCHHDSLSSRDNSRSPERQPTTARPRINCRHSSFSQWDKPRTHSPEPLSGREFIQSCENSSSALLQDDSLRGSKRRAWSPERRRVFRSSSRDTPSRKGAQPSPYDTKQQASGSERSQTPESERSFARTSSYGSSKSKSSSSGQDKYCGVSTRKSVDRSQTRSSCDLSSSSVDGPRTARRGRRPRPAAAKGVSATSQDNDILQTPRSAKKTASPRLKSTEFLNHSFNCSFNSLAESEDPATGLDAAEDENETPTLTRKLIAEGPNFAIPESPVKRRGSRSGGCFLDEENVLEVEEESMSSSPFNAPRSTQTRLYEYAQRCEWDRVSKECTKNPWTAKHVSEYDGTTALHLAVMSRANPMMRDGALCLFQPAPLCLIEQLIVACPEAAIIRCTEKRYTPLSYACLVADTGYDMSDSAKMVQIILMHSPHCSLVFTDDGFSALDVHTISYSRLHQEKEEVYSSTGRSSTVVLRALLNECPSLASARSYGSRVRGPLELLYRCNLKEFKQASGEDIARASKNSHLKKQAHSSVFSTLSDWWAWKWVLHLLEASSLLQKNDTEELAPFSAVHAASQLVGCPVPILALAIDAFPEQVKARSYREGLHNCPLHDVCSWVLDDMFIDGDPFVVKRKRRAIAMLLEAFPKAARMTNNLGDTPLQLAIETCTPWDSLEVLVRAFPRALTIPRSLELCREDSPLANAVALHNEDVGSVGSDEDEWDEDAINAVEGMYPFMVAGVMSHVPERRNHSPSFIFAGQERGQHQKNLENKDLGSLRSIFGLLRAKPEALALFFEDEKNRCTEVLDSTEGGDESEDETSTEAFVHLEDQSTEDEINRENGSENT